MLQGSVKNWDFIATDKYFALSPKNGGKDRDTDFMVFIANQPFNVDMNNGKNPEIETLLKLKETSFRALFSGINPTKDLSYIWHLEVH
ncbi:MAG: hypothetical protein B6229_09935 [Spirochaetaceae bacterium 4572_7]|nr:MAG: hypothetical protein B6229_09935 [Spirochaetaceae bacterium 4572_7]